MTTLSILLSFRDADLPFLKPWCTSFNSQIIPFQTEVLVATDTENTGFEQLMSAECMQRRNVKFKRNCQLCSV